MNVTTRRRIGRTALRATTIGYGSGPIGNRYRAVSDIDSQALVDHAWDNGVRVFDTAPMYGHGLAEHRLGQALRGRPRDEYVLSTKVGRLLRPAPPGSFDTGLWVDVPNMAVVYDYSHDGALRSLEDSLQRMLTDRVDVVFIHDCDVFTHGEAQPERFAEAMDGAYPALARLRAEGVVGAIGLGVNEAEVCAAAARHGDFDCFLLAGRYTLLEQEPLDDLLPLCTERGISLFLGGVYNSGILATGPVPGANYNYEPAPPTVVERVTRLAQVCDRFDVPLAAVALQFAAAHPAVASVLVGAATQRQQERNLAAAATPVPGELWTALRDSGLIRPDAPTP